MSVFCPFVSVSSSFHAELNSSGLSGELSSIFLEIARNSRNSFKFYSNFSQFIRKCYSACHWNSYCPTLLPSLSVYSFTLLSVLPFTSVCPLFHLICLSIHSSIIKIVLFFHLCLRNRLWHSVWPSVATHTPFTFPTLPDVCSPAKLKIPSGSNSRPSCFAIKSSTDSSYRHSS